MRAGWRRKLISGLLILAMMLSNLTMIAGAGEIVISKSQIVVTIGADLSEEQKAFMMQYFGLNQEEVQIITVTNEDEHKALDALLSEDRVGNETFSCAVVRPTSAGGIQVKTVNMTYVTSNMIASTLVTSGVYNCEVVTAAPFKVSGTGALTGVMMAYENASGDTIEPEKKELANEEIIITDEVSENVGKNRAILIVNDIKITIARDEVTDPEAVYAVVDNVIATTQQAAYEKAMKKGKDAPKEVTTEAVQRLYDFGKKFSQGGYKYKEMQQTLERVTYNVVEKTGFDDPIVDTFTTLDDEISLDPDSILLSTDDSLLGEKAVVNATNSVALGTHEAEKIERFKGDVTLTNGGSVKADQFIYRTSVVSYKDLNGSYALMDLNGNVLTEALYTDEFRGEYGHIEGYLNDGSNMMGLLETDGTVSIPFQYPKVEIYGTNWAAGMNLSETGTEDNYDYRFYAYENGESKDIYCMIDTIDMYYIDNSGGKLVGTLTRDQMQDQWSVNAYGPHINIKDSNGVVTVYDSEFNVLGTSEYLYAGSEDETDAIARAIEEKTGFYVNDFYGNYAVIHDYGKDSHNTGVVDLYGNYIVPIEFDRIDTAFFSENGSLVSNGYFAGELDGKFVYIKQGGKVLATFDYPVDDIRNYGMSAIYKTEDEKVTILAGDGTITDLGNTYSYVSNIRHSKGMLYECTTPDYKVDLLDWHGNVLLSGTKDVSLASNGNYLIARDGYTSSTLYLVNDASPVGLADSAGGAVEVESITKEAGSLEVVTEAPVIERVGEVLGQRFIRGTNLMIASNDNENYALMDISGQQLTNPIYTRSFEYYYGWLIAEHVLGSGETAPASGAESQFGLLNLRGQAVIPVEYDVVKVLGEAWAVGYRLTADATEDDYDFQDYEGGYYYVSEADVYHLSDTETLKVTLSRDQIMDIAAEGQYLNIEDAAGSVMTYDAEFNPIASVNSVYNFREFSAKQATSARLRDQTGYSIADERFPDGYTTVYDYSGDVTKKGVIDLNGEIILPVEYDDIEYVYLSDGNHFLANGYVGVVKDGQFSFVTSGGTPVSDKTYPEDNISFMGMTAGLKKDDGTYSLILADGTELTGFSYLSYSDAYGRGLIIDASTSDYTSVMLDFKGNVLFQDYVNSSVTEDGRYILIQQDYQSMPVLYSVNGAAQEDGLTIGGVSSANPLGGGEAVQPAQAEEETAADAMADEPVETEAAQPQTQAAQEPKNEPGAPTAQEPQTEAAGQYENSQEDTAADTTADAAADTAAASDSAAAPLLTSAINLINVDLDLNKDAVLVLLGQAQGILETENAAAGQLVASAITLINSGSDADPVLTLLNSAMSLL